MRGLRLALGTLTVVPVGDVGQISRPVARAAMLLAPAAALPLAGGAAAILWLATSFGFPAMVIGALVVGWLGLATRGMHLDGLADCVDGLAAGWSRERAMAVMRAGDVGPLGAAALIVVLLLQAVAVGTLSEIVAAPVVVAWTVCAARVACAGLTVSGLPAARPDGLGAAVAGVVPPWAVAAAVAGWTGIGVLLAAVTGLAWWLPLVSAAVATAAVWWLGRRMARLLGGVSGDVIGAGVEVAMTCLCVGLTAGLATR